MAHDLSPCPYLPLCREGLDWTALNRFEKSDRGEAFYFSCLEYGQSLWVRGFAARSILCIDRAMGADLSGGETILKTWPMPYAALPWMLKAVPEGTFIGNPRVHFQHYADRMNEPRKDQRRWRAWACWALVRAAMPELPADPRHVVEEPTETLIFERLGAFGLPGEATQWRSLLAGISRP